MPGPFAIAAATTGLNLGITALSKLLGPKRPKVSDYISIDDITIGDEFGAMSNEAIGRYLERADLVHRRAADSPLTGSARAQGIRSDSQQWREGLVSMLARISELQAQAKQFDATQKLRLGLTEYGADAESVAATYQGIGAIQQNLGQMGAMWMATKMNNAGNTNDLRVFPSSNDVFKKYQSYSPDFSKLGPSGGLKLTSIMDNDDAILKSLAGMRAGVGFDPYTQ